MDSNALIGVGITLGLSLVGSLLWVGRLQQRVAVLESRDIDNTQRILALQDRAASSDVARALADQKLGTAIIDINITRADVANAGAAVNEMKLQQTETRTTMKSIEAAMHELRDTVMRWERETRKLLNAAVSGRLDRMSEDDTPPQGMPRTSREP